MTTKIYIFCLSNDTTMSFLMTARAIQRDIVFIWIVFCDFPRHIITRHKRNTYFEKDVYRFWYPITTKYKYLDLLTSVFWCNIYNHFLAINEFAYHTFNLFGYKSKKISGNMILKHVGNLNFTFKFKNQILLKSYIEYLLCTPLISAHLTITLTFKFFILFKHSLSNYSKGRNKSFIIVLCILTFYTQFTVRRGIRNLWY